MSFWTDERVTELREHWEAGLTGGEIERAMGAPSRNAVVGKLHRLGLMRDDRGIKERVNRVRRGIAAAKQAPRKPRPTRPRAPPTLGEPVSKPSPPPAAGPVRAIWNACSILEVNDDRCRFPCACDVGAPGFHFCGAPTADDPPYCIAHKRIAYRRPGKPEETA